MNELDSIYRDATKLMQLAAKIRERIVRERKKKKSIEVGKDMQAIIDAVCEEFSVLPHELLSKGRPARVVFPRHVCMDIAATLTTMNYTEIAQSLGRKEHSTVTNAIEQVSARKATSEQIRKKIERCMKKIVDEGNGDKVESKEIR